jgi:hypothetical protein
MPLFCVTSVSLSADGNTAIVGGPGDNGQTGAAWVFTRDNGVWTQQGNKLVGTGAIGSALQGYSVALSADGNTAIVGGYEDNLDPNSGYGLGATWVYTRSGSAWTQQGGKLVGSGALGAAAQGVSVGLSADGNTAIVGGETDNSQAGAAWVFVQPGLQVTPTDDIVAAGNQAGPICGSLGRLLQPCRRSRAGNFRLYCAHRCAGPQRRRSCDRRSPRSAEGPRLYRRPFRHEGARFGRRRRLRERLGRLAWSTDRTSPTSSNA